jgi:nucleoid-associated protein YgaU
MRKFLLGVGSLLAIAVILVGVPIALNVVAGNPLPTAAQLHNIVTLVPDYGNVVLLTKVLPCLGWLAWILFAIPLLIEIGAGIAGRKTTKRIWLLKGQQQAAAVLVAAVLVMFAAAGFAHSPAPSAAPAPHTATVSIEVAEPAPATVPPAEPTIERAAVAVSSAPASSTETVIHMVVPGDNLWDISEKYYGVGTRDMDIFRASTGTVQPGGQRLTNPNLIRPGWQLTVPDVPAPPTITAPAPAAIPENGSSGQNPGNQESKSPTSADAVPAPRSSVEAAPSAVSTPSQASTPSPAADKPTVSQSDLAVPLRTAGGVVGLLAAAVLIVLGRRRLQQRRRRRAGERIAMPDTATAAFEQELRMVANPLGLADIDHALRLLRTHAQDTRTALPELLAVRLVEEEISLYFMQPTDLPTPFEPLTSEHTVWTFRPDVTTTPSLATVSPYPALVIVGVDDNDGVLLLDLEQLGILNVVGQETLALGILNALAAELAGNPWGEQIQVTVVGIPATLPRSIDRFRIRHVDDVEDVLAELEGDLGTRGTALHSFAVDDVRIARALAADTESWAPHLVLLGQPVEEPLASRITDLITRFGRWGVAIVANGSVHDSHATIRLDPSGHAELVLPANAMPPLPFTPQLLRDHELELLQGLLDTTEEDPVQPTLIDPTPVSTSTLKTAPEMLPESDGPLEGQEGAAEDSTPWQHETGSDAPAPNLPDDEQATGSMVPYLRFLGPVEVEGLGPAELLPGRGVELMAYLSLRGGPVGGLQLQKAFWPDTPDAANNQRGLAKKVRVALGHNLSGELWLPENINHHGYLLHPAIRSDWDDFRTLVGPDPAVASTDNLIAALHLVRGTPFAGSNTRRWWQWIAIPQEEMIAAVMDAAGELGTRALRAQNVSLTRYAARIQQVVDPLNEAGWRIELRAALQTGDLAGFHTVLEDLYARVGGDDPDYDVDDDTQILIDQANQRVRA